MHELGITKFAFLGYICFWVRPGGATHAGAQGAGARGGEGSQLLIWVQRVRGVCLVLALVGGVMGLTATDANADYKYCNNTSYVLRAAIAYESNNGWTSRGWWTLLPGQCRVVLPQDLKHRTYYTYAESVRGHKGGTKYFSGEHSFCTDEGYFTIQGRSECGGNGNDKGQFVEVRVGGGQTWTTTFTEPAEFNSEKAEIAGVQRLLTDNGYDAGRIDGHLGRKTRRAINSFKRANGVSVAGLISEELLNALAESASTSAQEEGFRFCNRTNENVWTAIGYELNDQWRSRGWWMLKPNTCAKVIKDALQSSEYYVYASVDRDNREVIVAGGDVGLCTADVKFDIKGREDCDLRGYNETSFAKVETDGAAFWNQEFGLNDVAQGN